MKRKTAIPFLNLHRQYKIIGKEINRAIKRVLDRQFFILGEELVAFEKEFAGFLGTSHVLGIGSGTDGLVLALRAVGVGQGDEVITPANSFIATTLAITELGATPVFVDCDPETYEMDVTQIAGKITSKTKALLPVHLYGAPADMHEIMKIARKHHLFVIEDACQSAGATLSGQQTGTFGDIGVFSFYPGKNLGAYGDGGALCTDNNMLFEKLRMLRNYGQSRKYYHDTIGVNSRLDEIQAAVLRVKLKYLDRWNRERNRIGKIFAEKLLTKTQKVIAGGMSNFHLLVTECDRRDELRENLESVGIETLIHYPVPIHLQKCYEYLGHKKGDFPVSERLAQTLVSLPMYAELTPHEISVVIDSVNTFHSRT